MTEAEADGLKILSKITEKVEEPMEMDMREGALKTRKRQHWEGDSVIIYAVAEVEKENSKKVAKNGSRKLWACAAARKKQGGSSPALKVKEWC